MNELNIYFIMFSLTDKMNNIGVFESFMQHNLIVATPRVRYIIISFPDTLTTLLSYPYKDINYFVKKIHGVNIARTANAKIMIPQDTTLGLKSVLLKLKEW